MNFENLSDEELISLYPKLLDELKSRKPEIIIIFAWNFADDIIKKLKEIVDWKLKCIVPLPEYKEKVL